MNLVSTVQHPTTALTDWIRELARAIRRLFAHVWAPAASLGRIPANAVDRALSFLGLMRDVMIQLELEFEQRIDEQRLSRALSLVLDAEPVLGCRLVDHWRRPFWERVDRSRRDVFQVVTDQADYERFKLRTIDIAAQPPIAACLDRSGPGDRLLLKIDHHVTDAGGLLEIAGLLSEVYDRLARDPSYVPPSNATGSRSMWQVMRRVPLRAYPRILLNFLEATGAYLVRRRTHTLPVEPGPATGVAYVSRTVPAEQVAEIAAYGKARGATINDLMLAACFRALAAAGRWDGESQLRLVTTVSNRRYLPGGRGEAITNLCGMEYPCLGTELGPRFDDTLERVVATTAARKASWPGLNDYVGLAPLLLSGVPHALLLKLFGALIDQGNKTGLPHSLSNVGRIDPARVTFGNPPTVARVLPGSSRPPQLFTCLSGYGGALFLSACVFDPQRALVEEFFDAVLAELPVSREGDES